MSEWVCVQVQYCSDSSVQSSQDSMYGYNQRWLSVQPEASVSPPESHC